MLRTALTKRSSDGSSHASSRGKYCTSSAPRGDTRRSRNAAGSASRNGNAAPSRSARAARVCGNCAMSEGQGFAQVASCARSAARAGVSGRMSACSDCVRSISGCSSAASSSASTSRGVRAIETANHEALALSAKMRRSHCTLESCCDCRSRRFD